MTRIDGGLSVRRRTAGFVVAVVAGPLLTWLLSALRNPDALPTEVLSYQLLVMIVALVGGTWPAVLTAVMSGLSLAYFFVEPLYSVVPVSNPQHLVALLLYIVTAVLVSILVNREALQTVAANRAAAELEPLLATDRVRSALLSALSHDLRRPLSAATTAVGGLRAARWALTDEDRDELLVTADESLTTLTGLLTDLLDVSRVEAGVLAVSLVPIDPADAIIPAIDELGLGPDRIELALDPELPPVSADPVLLQRVMVNLLTNAVRYAPNGSMVRIATTAVDGVAELRVVDHGPGVPAERRDDIFLPFQRLGDTDNGTGLGLGLALSKGFVEGMGGSLTPEDTSGGGLTMVIVLPFAERALTKAALTRAALTEPRA